MAVFFFVSAQLLFGVGTYASVEERGSLMRRESVAINHRSELAWHPPHRLHSFEETARKYGVADLSAVQLEAVNLPEPADTDQTSKVRIAQVLVLTLSNAESKARLDPLISGLHSLGFDNARVIEGVDFHKFSTEAKEEKQDVLPMSVMQRQEWMETTFGYGPIHHNKTAEETPSNGALACVMGHHRMWEMAAAAAPEDPHAWTLILEDDARVSHAHHDKLAVQKILASAPPDAHIVHLDDRHCQYFKGQPGIRGKEMNIYAAGSTAYAVTTAGAQMLLAEPFRYGADHWLNIPVHEGKMKALCPTGAPVFQHVYKHMSLIKEHADFGG